MEPVSLRWHDAEVSGGTLTVPIDGDPPDGWSDVFAQTVTLLGRGRHSDVRCDDGSIRVGGVREGEEESLRHFLESVVQEANAATDTGDPDAEGEAESEPQGHGRDAEDPDARMTERFRGFGEPAPADD